MYRYQDSSNPQGANNKLHHKELGEIDTRERFLPSSNFTNIEFPTKQIITVPLQEIYERTTMTTKNIGIQNA